MAQAVVTPVAAGTRSWRWVAVPVLIGALVSLTAGLLARHQPRSTGYFRLFFSNPVHLKAGFATAAVVLACFQLFTAAWISASSSSASSIRTTECLRTRCSAARSTERSQRR
jgi:hypothetical protein